MLDEESVRRLAESYLLNNSASSDPEDKFVVTSVREYGAGDTLYEVFYMARKYVDAGITHGAIGGNGLLLVDRHTSNVMQHVFPRYKCIVRLETTPSVTLELEDTFAVPAAQAGLFDVINEAADSLLGEAETENLTPAQARLALDALRERSIAEHGRGVYGASEFQQILGLLQQAIDQRVQIRFTL